MNSGDHYWLFSRLPLAWVLVSQGKEKQDISLVHLPASKKDLTLFILCRQRANRFLKGSHRNWSGPAIGKPIWGWAGELDYVITKVSFSFQHCVKCLQEKRLSGSPPKFTPVCLSDKASEARKFFSMFRSIPFCLGLHGQWEGWRPEDFPVNERAMELLHRVALEWFPLDTILGLKTPHIGICKCQPGGASRLLDHLRERAT